VTLGGESGLLRTAVPWAALATVVLAVCAVLWIRRSVRPAWRRAAAQRITRRHPSVRHHLQVQYAVMGIAIAFAISAAFFPALVVYHFTDDAGMAGATNPGPAMLWIAAVVLATRLDCIDRRMFVLEAAYARRCAPCGYDGGPDGRGRCPGCGHPPPRTPAGTPSGSASMNARP